MLGVPQENVRVISRFLGSGFGGKLWPWTHCLIAASAARNLNRPVKLVVTRDMMFQNVGHRPRTQQRIRIGAASDGKLVSLMHDSLNHTSILDDYSEGCSEATGYSYSTPNLRATSGLVRRNVGTPTSMRGPGAVPGLFALESAMDELAVKLNMDPIKLRLLNEPANRRGQEPALLFAPLRRVSQRRRRKIRLVAAHSTGRLDEEGRLDSGLGCRRLLLDCRAHGHRSHR